DFNPSGIILSGGPESTTEENSPRAPQYVFEAGVPVFGVCYGMNAHRFPAGLAGIVPQNTAGLGDVEKAERIYKKSEVAPVQRR
ncbi:hypothetical protein MJM83_33810, partial [Salmonella enterica subsp. enterica serovar Montevideo]|nr:hypothetical protein [Salmonella enterica subsp. enterica serovar Montevideo]